jgi:hypothetical protein
MSPDGDPLTLVNRAASWRDGWQRHAEYEEQDRCVGRMSGPV